MSFNKNSRLDPSQVEDRRGRSTGSRIAICGGGLGLIIVVIALIMGVNPSTFLNLAETVPPSSDVNSGSIGDMASQCQTGADASARQDCAVVGYVNSIQAFWADEFAGQGIEYVQAQTVLFSGATDAACGYASSATGPFYCPTDQSVYLDLTFLDDLQTRFGAKGGPFAEAYVLAHEYGHHVQDLLGILDSSQGSNSDSVFTELQADCLAGVWMFHAVDTGYLTEISDQDVADAVDAAAAVGDDRIQLETQGYVSPETWTHGSSEERQAALLDGLRSGDVNSCETPGW